MLENKVASGLKISSALLALAIVHGLGNFLGNIFLLSDIFTVVGAIGTYRFLTDSFVREEVSEAVSDAIDLDQAAAYLVDKGLDFAGSLGLDFDREEGENYFVEFLGADTDELEDTFAQEEERIEF